VTDATYEFGWRKFRLDVPEPWEPAHFEGDDAKGYVRLDDVYGPRLELRWGLAYREDACDTAFEQYLKGLRRDARKKKGAGVFRREPKEVALVSAWPEGMKGRVARWSAEIDCVSAVVACSVCNRLTALRVLFAAREMRTSVARRILESFRDHTASVDAPSVWSLYRMRFEVPSRWRLAEHRFGPGYAEMRFRGPGRLLADVRRWGPAEVLLRRQSLEAWYLGQLAPGVRVEAGDLDRTEVRGDEVLSFERRPGGVAAVLGRLSRGKQARRRLALVSAGWHCASTNRLWVVDVYGASLDEAREAEWRAFCHADAEEG